MSDFNVGDRVNVRTGSYDFHGGSLDASVYRDAEILAVVTGGYLIRPRVGENRRVCGNNLYLSTNESMRAETRDTVRYTVRGRGTVIGVENDRLTVVDEKSGGTIVADAIDVYVVEKALGVGDSVTYSEAKTLPVGSIVEDWWAKKVMVGDTGLVFPEGSIYTFDDIGEDDEDRLTIRYVAQ